MIPCAVLALIVQMHAPAASPSPAPSPSASPFLSPLAPPTPAPAATPAAPEVIAPPAPEVVFDLLKKAPAFGAESGRAGFRGSPTTPVRVPGVDDKGYFIEVKWADKAAVEHTGVVVVAHTSVLDVPWLVKGEGEWGLVQVFEDKTLPALMDELKRTRIAANEAVAVGDIRTFITGQMLFMSLADGAFGELRCLRMPADCIAGVPEEQMMPPENLVADRRGYKRTFHAGARVNGPKAKGKPSPFVKTFAYTAVPLVPGETGVRGFCGDSTGKVCVTPDGGAPAVSGGLCVKPCTELLACPTGTRWIPKPSTGPGILLSGACCDAEGRCTDQ